MPIIHGADMQVTAFLLLAEKILLLIVWTVLGEMSGALARYFIRVELPDLEDGIVPDLIGIFGMLCGGFLGDVIYPYSNFSLSQVVLLPFITCLLFLALYIFLKRRLS